MCKRVGECASGRVSVQTCARNMEGGSGAAAAAAAAFTNIYTAAFTAGAIGTGSSLDEAERSVLSINHPQINAPRRCFLPPRFSPLFSETEYSDVTVSPRNAIVSQLVVASAV